MTLFSVKRLLAVVLALAAGSGLAAHASEDQTLTLFQAVKMGLEQSPTLVAVNAMATAAVRLRTSALVDL